MSLFLDKPLRDKSKVTKELSILQANDYIGENLKESPVKGQEVLVNKTISGQDICININGEQGTNLIVWIER